MVKGCPRCYAERMATVPIVENDGEWHCKKNPKHRFKMDAQGFPRLIK